MPSTSSLSALLPFDRAVLEKIDRLKIVPYRGEWSDVGFWDEIAKLTSADQGGNRVDGEALIDGSSDVFTEARDRLTVAIGLGDTVIIDTPDALLVMDRSRLSELRGRGGTRGPRPAGGQTIAAAARPWGAFEKSRPRHTLIRSSGSPLHSGRSCRCNISSPRRTLGRRHGHRRHP